MDDIISRPSNLQKIKKENTKKPKKSYEAFDENFTKTINNEKIIILNPPKKQNLNKIQSESILSGIIPLGTQLNFSDNKKQKKTILPYSLRKKKPPNTHKKKERIPTPILSERTIKSNVQKGTFNSFIKNLI